MHCALRSAIICLALFPLFYFIFFLSYNYIHLLVVVAIFAFMDKSLFGYIHSLASLSRAFCASYSLCAWQMTEEEVQ